MKGKPKYKYDDTVEFMFGDCVKIGKVYIIDKFGTIEDNSDVSYDILIENENMLYKHINEKYVTKRIKRHYNKRKND